MKKILYIILALAIIAAVGYAVAAPGKPGAYDGFVQCMKDKGTVFYGAFWCPHCRDQKAMFGKSAKLLPYVECSTPDGQGMIAACQEKGVKGYPTWHFPDGTTAEGTVSLAALAERTACELPAGS